MDPTLVALGLTGSLLFAWMAYFTLGVRRNLETEPEVAVRMFFLDSRALKSFKVHAGSMVLLAVSLVVQVAALISGMDTIRYSGHVMAVLSITGIMYFYLGVYRATTQHSKRKK